MSPHLVICECKSLAHPHQNKVRFALALASPFFFLPPVVTVCRSDLCVCACRVQRVSGRSPGPTQGISVGLWEFQRPRADPSRGRISGHGAETVAKGGGERERSRRPKAEGVIDRPTDRPAAPRVRTTHNIRLGRGHLVVAFKTAPAHISGKSTDGVDPTSKVMACAARTHERAERCWY